LEKMDEAGLVGEAERPLQSENAVFPRAVVRFRSTPLQLPKTR